MSQTTISYDAKITACADLLLQWTERDEDNPPPLFTDRWDIIVSLAPRLAIDGPLSSPEAMAAPWRVAFATTALALGMAQQPLPPLLGGHTKDHAAGRAIRAEIMKRMGMEPVAFSATRGVASLFFNDRGCGPDSVALHAFAVEIGGGLPAVVALGAPNVSSPFGMHTPGGYSLDVDAAEKLCAELVEAVDEAKRLSGKVPS